VLTDYKHEHNFFISTSLICISFRYTRIQVNKQMLTYFNIIYIRDFVYLYMQNVNICMYKIYIPDVFIFLEDKTSFLGLPTSLCRAQTDLYIGTTETLNFALYIYYHQKMTYTLIKIFNSIKLTSKNKSNNKNIILCTYIYITRRMYFRPGTKRQDWTPKNLLPLYE
jgi:hypothetical protein